MQYFNVHFEKRLSAEVVVGCQNRDELDRGIEGTLKEGLDPWVVDDGEWELDFVGKCAPHFDPAKEVDLQGIDRTDPDCWRIVPACDATTDGPETEDERRLREFREAEEHGQAAFAF